MSSLGGGQIVTNGLVLALDAANVKSYPGSGTTWFDRSGFGNNGTLINGPTFSNGSIVFDGTNDYITISQFKNTYSFNTPFTISCFVRPTNTTIRTDIVSTFNQTFNDGVFVELANQNIRFAYRQLGTNIFDFNTTNLLPSNTFLNIVALYNGTAAMLYVNTVLQSPTTNATSFFSIAEPTLTIGRVNEALGRYFLGNIANIQIYNKALTPAEIQQNYLTQKSRFGL